MSSICFSKFCSCSASEVSMVSRASWVSLPMSSIRVSPSSSGMMYLHHRSFI